MKVERDQACPLLGTRANPDTHFAYPTLENHCYAHHRVSPLSLDEQQTLCLGGAYRSCRFYLGHQARLAATQVAGERLEAASAPVPNTRPNPLLFLGVAVLFFFVCGLMVFASGVPQAIAQGLAQAITPAPTETPTRTPTRTNTPTALPPTGTPVPPTSTGLPATGTATTRPTATPIIYIVQSGDTPGGIAARFGITAQALMAANGITDARSLRTGQRLVIPLPPTPTPTPQR